MPRLIKITGKRVRVQSAVLLDLPAPALEVVIRMAPLQINSLCRLSHSMARFEIERILLNQILELYSNPTHWRDKLRGLFLFLERRGTLTISEIQETLAPMLTAMHHSFSLSIGSYLGGPSKSSNVVLDTNTCLWDAYLNLGSLTICTNRKLWFRIIERATASGMPTDVMEEILSRSVARPDVYECPHSEGRGSDFHLVRALLEREIPASIVSLVLNKLEIADDVINCADNPSKRPLPSYDYMKDIWTRTRLSLSVFICSRLSALIGPLDSNSRRFIEAPLTVSRDNPRVKALQFVIVMRHMKGEMRDTHPWVDDIRLSDVASWISGPELIEHGLWILSRISIEPGDGHLFTLLRRITRESDPTPILGELSRAGQLEKWLSRFLPSASDGLYAGNGTNVIFSMLDEHRMLSDNWKETSSLLGTPEYLEYTSTVEKFASVLEQTLKGRFI